MCVIYFGFFMTSFLTSCDFQSDLVEYTFNKDSINDWYVINDGVMGGKSKGEFELDANGIGQFSGFVSLENNGGFTMMSNSKINWSVRPSQNIRIMLKGDGKEYQFRIRADNSSYYSYVHTFKTSGEWEIIEFPLEEMYASWRGMKQDIPNFDKNSIEEIAFLVGNKKAESFKLLIEKVEVN